MMTFSGSRNLQKQCYTIVEQDPNLPFAKNAKVINVMFNPLARTSKGHGYDLAQEGVNAILDLLQKSRFEFQVVNGSDQVETQPKAFSPITVPFTQNPKDF